MIQLEKFEVELISGLRCEGRRRGVAFLVCAQRKDIDAKEVFNKLKEKKRQDVLNRLDYWLDGGICDKYFHGWPNNPKYKDCFVFRWSSPNAYHRLYGFLFNPRPLTDRGYQVCILVSHAQKNTANTDPSELDGANELRANMEVIREVKKVFPELKGGK